ncbi:MAG: hypothetical protein V4864_18565 [Pseudomonadota bacterium]
MKFKPLLIAVAAVCAAAVLAVAGGPGGWAAGGLFAVVAGYLLLRRPPTDAAEPGPERFFSDAGEETALTDLRTPPANDSRIDAPARERSRR